MDDISSISITTLPVEDPENRFVDKRRSNIKSDLIEITEDKLENILLKHLGAIQLKHRWVTPFTLCLSVLTTLCTSTFKVSFGFDSSVWQAVFILVAVSSGLVFVYSLLSWWFRRNDCSIDSLLRRIKNAEEERPRA